MNIPKLFYGTYKDVLSRCRPIINGLAKGKSVDRLFTGPFQNTLDCEGLLILNGPNPLLGSGLHFHVYLPLLLIDSVIMKKELDISIEEKTFTSFCCHTWSTLSLISPANLIWLHPVERHLPFLSACLKNWDNYESEPEKFTEGSIQGKRLWSIVTNVKHILARQGMSSELLNADIPKKEIKSCIQSVIDNLVASSHDKRL